MKITDMAADNPVPENIPPAAAAAEPLPKAIRTVFWRILLFYIGSIFVVGTLIAYTDPKGNPTCASVGPPFIEWSAAPA